MRGRLSQCGDPMYRIYKLGALATRASADDSRPRSQRPGSDHLVDGFCGSPRTTFFYYCAYKSFPILFIYSLKQPITTTFSSYPYRRAEFSRQGHLLLLVTTGSPRQGHLLLLVTTGMAVKHGEDPGWAGYQPGRLKSAQLTGSRPRHWPRRVYDP